MIPQSTVVVGLPLSTVESNLWDVTAWPAFLSGLESARRSSHERYVFGVRAGRSRHDALVAVRWHARDHRFSWQALEGPAWNGSLGLQAVNGRRTRLTLQRVVHPRSFWSGLAGLLGGDALDLDGDLGRLQDRLATLPAPVRPGRLAREAAAGVPAPRRSADRPAAERPGVERPGVERPGVERPAVPVPATSV